MLIWVIANILDMIDNSIYLFSSNASTKNKMALYQTCGCLFGMCSKLLLGGYTGFCMGIATLTRNLCIYNNKFNKLSLCIVLTIQIVGAILVNEGIFGVVATVATVSYTLMLYKSSSKADMCIAVMINTCLWCIYNIHLYAVAASIFNILSFINAFRNYRKLSA